MGRSPSRCGTRRLHFCPGSESADRSGTAADKFQRDNQQPNACLSSGIAQTSFGCTSSLSLLHVCVLPMPWLSYGNGYGKGAAISGTKPVNFRPMMRQRQQRCMVGVGTRTRMSKGTLAWWQSSGIASTWVAIGAGITMFGTEWDFSRHLEYILGHALCFISPSTPSAKFAPHNRPTSTLAFGGQALFNAGHAGVCIDGPSCWAERKAEERFSCPPLFCKLPETCSGGRDGSGMCCRF